MNNNFETSLVIVSHSRVSLWTIAYENRYEVHLMLISEDKENDEDNENHQDNINKDNYPANRYMF